MTRFQSDGYKSYSYFFILGSVSLGNSLLIIDHYSYASLRPGRAKEIREDGSQVSLGLYSFID